MAGTASSSPELEPASCGEPVDPQLLGILGRSEETLLALIQGASDGILIVARGGTIVLANRRVAELFGYQIGDLLGTPISQLVPMAVEAAHSSHCDGFFDDPRARPMGIGLQLAGRRSDGTEFPAEVSLSCVDSPAGTLVLAFVVDISARVDAQRKLRQAKREAEQQYLAAEQARSQLRATLDATSEGMMVVSPTGEVLGVNRTFTDMFPAAAAADIIGHGFGELRIAIHQAFADPDRFLSAILETASDQETVFTDTFEQLAPVPRQLELVSSAVHTSERTHVGRLFAFRDVTLAREVDRMKTEFVSLVSHELRTPLTSIKGFTDLVLDGDAGETTEEQVEYLTIVQQNATRLVALVNDLLDVSRIESGRIQLRREPVRMRDLVSVTAGTMSGLMEDKKQSLIVSAEPDLPVIEADRDRMVQVLTNLLSNAYKYTPEGGTIHIDASHQGDRVLVAIKDTGIGISPEDQDRLFTRFYRVDNSMTRQIGGTGLGLSITKSIVEMHGGEVGVHSEAGQGSTFWFSVPCAQPDVQDVDATTARASGPLPTTAKADASVLVVEDEPDIARLILRHLGRAGYRASAVATAEEALGRIREDPPDLVSIDIGLPGMDGLDLAAKLRQDEATRGIPVLVVSVRSDDIPEGQTEMQAISKPIDEGQLVATVGRLIGSQAAPRVLVADDDPGIRLLLETAFRSAGFDVILAADGAEAVGLAHAEGPDLILLDLRMPEMDGFAALRALKSDPATRDTPVVVMTGSDGLATGTRAMVISMGAESFVSKPFDVDQLIGAVVSMTGGEEQ